MQQTLLAFLALLIVTILSFNQQRANIRSQQESIRAQYRQAALGVAKQTHAAIRTRSFDQDTESFTPESSSNWGGKDCIHDDKDRRFDNNCSAIEHFHDDTTTDMDNADGIIRTRVPGDSLNFQVEVEVHYVKDTGSKIVRASSTTRLKEVTVRVQDCRDGDPSDGDPCDGSSILPTPISLVKVLGYSN
jgi:hypothetical protein